MHEAHTLGEFLRKVAIDYVRYGYYHYLMRSIPEEKDVGGVDQRVKCTYAVTSCRVTRLRRKRAGLANIAYVRWGHRFVLLATCGRHQEIEKRHFIDIRHTPLYIDGYSIGVRCGKPCVMIAPKRYEIIRSHLHAIALFHDTRVTDYVQKISPFTFPGIVRQKRRLLLEVNKRRKRAGLATIKLDVRFTKKNADSPVDVYKSALTTP